MALLRIDGLHVSGIIGVHEWERRVPQAMRLDVELEVDVAAAAVSDRLEDALDYGALADALAARVAASRCLLVERLAVELLEQVMQTCSPRRCRLTLHKPGAIPDAASVSITVDSQKLAS